MMDPEALDAAQVKTGPVRDVPASAARLVDPAHRSRMPPQLSVISPTFNERSNIRPLVAAIGRALAGIHWELVVVDDDSPDRTYDEVASVAREGWPVRCIRRVGRRGLASAVVEGALSCHSEYIAVIDADMQHDELLLPAMLRLLRTTDIDLVVGSRYMAGGSLGTWSASRRWMSRVATRCSSILVGSAVSDPMSGFFAMRNAAFQASLYNLSQQGYKILLDVMASSPTRLKVAELPYVFRSRLSGESKMDVSVLAEYLFLLIEKFTRGFVPPRFVLFSMVGGIGLLLHLAVLQLLKTLGFGFLAAQGWATISAMTLNYVVNNSVTYRNQRLRGWPFLRGYLLFCSICSMGAVANIGVADLAIHAAAGWRLAGIAGALMSAVFNFGVATQVVWRQRRRLAPPAVAPAA